MVFTGNYLRVLTPRTTDGVTPVMDDGRLVYKEDFLPLSAMGALQKQNEKLPEILKKKIEVVKNTDSGNTASPAASKVAATTSKK